MLALIDNKENKIKFFKTLVSKRILTELELCSINKLSNNIEYYKENSMYSILTTQTENENIYTDYEKYFHFPRSFSGLLEGLYYGLTPIEAAYLPEKIFFLLMEKDQDLSFIWFNVLIEFLEEYKKDNINEKYINYYNELIEIIYYIKINKDKFKEGKEIIEETIEKILTYRKNLPNDLNINVEILKDISKSLINSEEVYSLFCRHFFSEYPQIEYKYLKIIEISTYKQLK